MIFPTPAAALSWLRAHPRSLVALGLLLAFVVGYGAHRPAPKIEYREKVVTQTQYVDRVVEKRVEVAAKNTEQEHVTHRVETVKRDGTKVIVLDTATGTDTQMHVGSLATVNVTQQGTSTTTRETSLVQTPAALPSWRIGALAGLSSHGLCYGGEVSHRLVGPIWASAGVLVGAQPVGVVGLGVEF